MASLQDFMNHVLKHDLARSNKFRVLIPLPQSMLNRINNTAQEKTTSIFGEDVYKLVNSFVGGSASEIARGLDIMVESTELPGRSFRVVDVKYNGKTQKAVDEVVFSAQQFVFNVSTDMHEKNIIDEWMNIIHNPDTHEVEYLDEFVTNIIISQLDKNDRPVYSVVLKDAFPTACNPVGVSNATQNETITLSTEFAYSKWIRIEDDKNSPSHKSSLSQTPLGRIVTPILANPAVKRALDIIENETGIDLDGEAANIYNQLDDIVRSTTGTTINKSSTLINGMKTSTATNDKITSQQQSELIQLMDDVLSKLGV